ncbi:hypothetical protein PGB90_004602 [Kerria lacca]
MEQSFKFRFIIPANYNQHMYVKGNTTVEPDNSEKHPSSPIELLSSKVSEVSLPKSDDLLENENVILSVRQNGFNDPQQIAPMQQGLPQQQLDQIPSGVQPQQQSQRIPADAQPQSQLQQPQFQQPQSQLQQPQFQQPQSQLQQPQFQLPQSQLQQPLSQLQPPQVQLQSPQVQLQPPQVQLQQPQQQQMPQHQLQIPNVTIPDRYYNAQSSPPSNSQPIGLQPQNSFNSQLPGQPYDNSMPKYPDTGTFTPPYSPNQHLNDLNRWTNNPPNVQNWRNWPSNSVGNEPVQPNINPNMNGVPSGLNLNTPDAQLGYSYIMALLSGIFNNPDSLEGLLEIVTALSSFLNKPGSLQLFRAFNNRVQNMLNDPNQYNRYINNSPNANVIVQTKGGGGILGSLFSKGKDIITILKGFENAKGKALENLIKLTTGGIETGLGLIDDFTAPVVSAFDPTSSSSIFRNNSNLLPFLNFNDSK